MSKLSKNIIYNLFGQGLVVVISFIAIRYIFKQLGGDMLGIIYFALAFSAVMYAVLEAGICSTTIREVAAYSESEPEYIKGMIRTASFFYWLAYCFLVIIIWFSTPFLVDKWLTLKTIDNTTATQVLRILLIGIMTILPQRFYGSLVRGLQKMKINNLIDVAMMGLQQIGIILILVFGGGIIKVAYWFLISYGFAVIVYLFFAAHYFSWSSLIPGYSAHALKRFSGFAKNMMSISILSMIYAQADKLIISKLLPIGAVGYYSAGYSGLSKGGLISDSVAQAAFPSMSALSKAGDRSALMSQYRKLHDLICFITVPIFTFIPFFAVPIFAFVFNEEIAGILFLPVIFLSVGFYMHGTGAIPYYFSLAVGKPEISAKANFLALFIVLPATIILIYFLGLTGAGLSWVFYHIFSYFYCIPRICKECLGIPVKSWYFHIFKIIVLAILTYGTSWSILWAINNTHLIISLILAYSITSIIFLVSAYFMISEDLRETIFSYLRIVKVKILKII